MSVSDSNVNGTYTCNFACLEINKCKIQGTIDANGVVNGLIDVTVSFDNTTYQLNWGGTHQNNVLTASTTDLTNSVILPLIIR